MPIATERIPIPWPQRWEIFRERIFPVACFVATIIACGWLWQYQSRVAPFALGEVHVQTAKVDTPYDGELLPVEEHAEGQWPLFTEIRQGKVAARVKRNNESGNIVEIAAPLSGSVTEVQAHAGEHLKRGDTILVISSHEAPYVLCHLPYQGQEPPQVGSPVDIRPQGRGLAWTRSVVLAVGPAVEATPTFEGIDMSRPGRGIPLRIAVPESLAVKPGSLVEVRFGPTPPPPPPAP